MRPLDVLRSWAVQDSPPGAAIAAVVARVPDTPVGWLDEAPVVALYNPRTATAVVPDDEVAAFGTAFLPPDDQALKAIVDTRAADLRRGLRRAGPARRRRDLGRAGRQGAQPRRPARAAATDAAERAAAVVRGLPEPPRPPRPARDGGAQRAAVHLRPRRAASPPSRAPTSASAGRRRRESRPGAELVRRYRRTYGATSVAHFADWAGLGRAHAKQLWELADDAPRRQPLDGVRLLAPGDPILLGRDREALLPDPAARKKVWAALGGMGIVLADGEPVALWRGRKKGKKLEVSVEALAKRLPKRDIETQLERLAPHRGCTSVVVSFP